MPNSNSDAKNGSGCNNNFAALRDALFETMNAVKNGTMDLDRARVVNGLGKTLVESAMVEVEFIKATGLEGSGFISADDEDGGAGSTDKHLRLASSSEPKAHNPFPVSKRHRLEG